MKNKRQLPINCIEDCLLQANLLNRKIDTEPRLYKIFKHLAGDDTTGLMAYAIWRGRSQLLSTLNCASGYKQSEANASRVSQAQSCWQMEGVAFGDLSNQRRLGR